MKKNIFFGILLLSFSLVLISPAQVDTTKQQTKKEEKKTEFKDENANGIDDSQEQQNTNGKKKRNRVRFIDADGDGICDGRASGAGLKLRIHETNGKQQGKK